jgi:hypothetical protein
VPDAVAVDLERIGISPAELAQRVTRRRSPPLSAGDLQRWLLEHDLAVVVDGGLVPTALGIELGAAIVPTKEA